MLEFPSRHEILKLFEQDPQRTFRLRELVLEFGLRSSQARELKGVLKDLARSKKLVYLKKNHYALVHKGRYAAPDSSAAPPEIAQPGEWPLDRAPRRLRLRRA
jgi:exoribonuclease R